MTNESFTRRPPNDPIANIESMCNALDRLHGNYKNKQHILAALPTFIAAEFSKHGTIVLPAEPVDAESDIDSPDPKDPSTWPTLSELGK